MTEQAIERLSKRFDIGKTTMKQIDNWTHEINVQELTIDLFLPKLKDKIENLIQDTRKQKDLISIFSYQRGRKDGIIQTIKFQ